MYSISVLSSKFLARSRIRSERILRQVKFDNFQFILVILSYEDLGG